MANRIQNRSQAAASHCLSHLKWLPQPLKNGLTAKVLPFFFLLFYFLLFQPLKQK